MLRLDQRHSKFPVHLIRDSTGGHDIQLQKRMRIRWQQACGAAMDRTDSTIDLTLNAAGLRLLLDAVTHELDRWSGGEPSEQDNLQEMINQKQERILLQKKSRLINLLLPLLLKMGV